uniref:THAP domain-containing protein 1 n=1 Tax=Neogobius melanostomus TaxID=47308 RepID=A0A8C6TSK3_9GOBI
MVISCCALGCSNRQGCKPNLPFYHIPADEDRRRLWLAAINRKHWQPSKYSRICGEHFLQGQKSQDPLSPDYVPSVFAHTTVAAKRYSLKTLQKYGIRQEMKKKRKQQSSRNEDARGLFNPTSEETVPKENNENVADMCEDDISNDVMCQTDLRAEHIELLQRQCEVLQSKTFTLKQQLYLHLLEQNSFEN